jgi:hypothetical protein
MSSGHPGQPGPLLEPEPASTRLLDLAPLLPHDLLAMALDIAEQVDDPALRARLLSGLVGDVPREWRPRLIGQCLELAAALDAESERADVYLNLVAYLPPEAVSDVARRARAFRDPVARDRVLDAYRPYLAGIGGVLGGAGPPRPRTRTLRTRLATMDPAGRETALRDAVAQIGMTLGVGPRVAGAAEPPRPPDRAGAEPPELEAVPGDEPSPAVPGDQPSPAVPGDEPPGAADVDGSRPRVVSTGLASPDEPGGWLDPDLPLAVGQQTVFWLEIGSPAVGSIEETPVALPDLPAGVRLTVALTTLEGDGLVVRGHDVGELSLGSDGTATVIRQPGQPVTAEAAAGPRETRLLFPLAPPTRAGTFRFRCNIYATGVLVQSRHVRIRVMARPRRTAGALRSRVEDTDYSLSATLGGARLAQLGEHRLSVLVNRNDDGTHGFYFHGASGEWETNSGVSFTGEELQEYIEAMREALRLAAWGDGGPWNRQPYRYADGSDPARLTGDLIRMCIRGYRLYNVVIDRLAGADGDGGERARQLAEVMRQPGLIQVALKERPEWVLPAALIYDHELDGGMPIESYQLCGQFLADLAAGTVLETAPCFVGDCPNRVAHKTTICPGGLWGFRHALGFPISVGAAEVAPADREIAARITYTGAIELDAGIATDPGLTEWDRHEVELRRLRDDTSWQVARTREATFALLRDGRPHVVYFYCHGGVANRFPYLQVGDATRGEGQIYADNLRSERISWKQQPPLVFINGCHTAALEPESAYQLVSGFVKLSSAAGVIGTEITIFEPLARAFAEEFLRRFLGGEPVGTAIRGARLRLLAQGNPLGLVYIPYAIASLQMVEAH